jgi:hypothetical protein
MEAGDPLPCQTVDKVLDENQVLFLFGLFLSYPVDK